MRRRFAIATLAVIALLMMGAPPAGAVIPYNFVRAATGTHLLDIDVTVMNLTANSLCARFRVQQYVGLNSTETITLGVTDLDGVQGKTSNGTDLVPETPVVSTPWGDQYTMAEREDCWVATPTAGLSVFTIMADVGAGMTAYKANMNMRRAVDTYISMVHRPAANPICSGRRVTFSGQLYARAEVWDVTAEATKSAAMLPAPVVVRIQFRRSASLKWTTIDTDSTALPWGEYSWRHKVTHSGIWRVKFPGDSFDPVFYRPTLSAEGRVNVIRCI